MDAKLHLLKFTRSQASSATENGNLTSMERVRNTFESRRITIWSGTPRRRNADRRKSEKSKK